MSHNADEWPQCSQTRIGAPNTTSSPIVGIRRINAMVTRVASTDVTVLISGESGVGKEVVARLLHRRSRRRDGPFVKVNCAARPLEFLERELFGDERALTRADRQKRGKLEQANRGTILLDEISEMPRSVQARLLQVLQDHQFARSGSERDIQVNVRVITATNRELSWYVAHGGFRQDLFYQLNVVNIRVPALRERPEEIAPLVAHFLTVYRRKYGGGPRQLSPATLAWLQRYRWPGNVRELKNVIQRIVVLGSEEVAAELKECENPTPSMQSDAIASADITSECAATADSLGLKEIVRKVVEATEHEVLKRTLTRMHWCRIAAAGHLKISYKTLLEKIKYYRLDAADS